MTRSRSHKRPNKGVVADPVNGADNCNKNFNSRHPHCYLVPSGNQPSHSSPTGDDGVPVSDCVATLSTSSNHLQCFFCPLLPGLPDDLAILCLARLPLYYLMSLRIVSKSWRNALGNPQLQVLREKLGASEGSLYVETWNSQSKNVSWFAFDCTERKWRRLPPVPIRRGLSGEIFGRTSTVMKGHLIVVGGKAGYSGPTLRDVFVFSPISNKWTKRKSMIHTRHSPLTSILGGKLYVLGGFDCFNLPVNAFECYDFELDEWKEVRSEGHPKLSSPSWFQRGWAPEWLSITLGEDRFYCCYSKQYCQGYTKLYDPVAGEWQHRSNGMKAIHRYGLNAVLGGKLYSVDWAAGRVRVADVSGVGWINLKGLSLRDVPWVSILTANPRMVGLGGQLYVVRRGLHVVVIKLKNSEEQGDCSPVLCELPARTGAEDEEVIICHVLVA
eukprot:c17048_g1_i1 orf=435-1757(+)